MNGRIRKEHIKKLAESPPDKEAYRRFKRPPYQVGRLIRTQAEQIRHMDAAEYLKQKGAVEIGQEEVKAVPGIAERAETE